MNSTQESSSPFTHMKTALDIAPRSPHPTNKIAAVLFGHDDQGKTFSIIRTNHWPNVIYEHFGRKTKIGNSSGTIHAETSCIMSAIHATNGASLCITDPFCPNCAKNIAEAGIKNIYIDQDGFDKDFFKRRGNHFDAMSMQICARAGINVYKLNMLTESKEVIYESPNDYIPVEDSPIHHEPIESMNEAIFNDIIMQASNIHQRRKFAIALVMDKQDNKFALTARAHAVIGYSMDKPDEALDLLTPIGKYSFIQEPVNRLMMHIRRHGYRLWEGFLYCSQVPTSREQVNLVGGNIERITIGNIQKSRDPNGLTAMQMLRDKKILNYS